MANLEHIEWLLEGVEAWNTRREQAEFRPDFEGVDNADLREADLTNADLVGAKFNDAKLNNTNLTNADLREADLTNADLADAILTDARLNDADLRNAKLCKANLTKAAFTNADLRNAKLYKADLTKASLSGAKLHNADLRNAKLYKAQLIGTKLIKACLFNADLSKAKLHIADLTSTDLCQAKLIDAKLDNTKLVDTILFNAKLRNADLTSTDLTGADLSYSKPWKANLYKRTSDTGQSIADEARDELKKKIKSIECLLKKCRCLRDEHKDDDVLFYFRGEICNSWELRPSVMRPSRKDEFKLRASEGEMLLDLMSRQPDDFNDSTSAIEQWVLAQHHGLKTRLLDITRNPLVALFNACKICDAQNGTDSEDGRLHVFAIPRCLVKPFNSDTISIIANFSKLSRNEQFLLLGNKPKPKLQDGSLTGDCATDPFYSQDEVPIGDYAQAMGRLYHFIRHEKPYFLEKIDPRDLFRVFVVEPQRSFERIRAQSGAFLISAFHERFERKKILDQNAGIPIYYHYVLTVSGKSKRCLVNELRLLNITCESLFPGLDEAATAVTQRYSGEWVE